MARIAFIYNPRAGKLLRKPELVERTLAHLQEHGTVIVCPTTGPNAARAIATREIEAGADWVAALGGDGTINEVANGMIGTRTILVPLPGGTANVLCVETGIGTDPVKAAARLGECEPVRIALGLLRNNGGTGRYFLAMAGAGVDAMVVSEVNPKVKEKLGKLAYWVSGVSSMFGGSLPEFHSTIDGHLSRRSFVLASRVRNYGGDLEIAQRITLLDDALEAVSFTGASSIRYMPYLLGVAIGKPDLFPGVDMRMARAFTLEAAGEKPVRVQVDGEAAGFLPATIEVVPDAIGLLLPRTYLEKARRQRWTTSPTA